MITFSVEHNNVSNSEFSSLCKMKRTVYSYWAAWALDSMRGTNAK